MAALVLTGCGGSTPPPAPPAPAPATSTAGVEPIARTDLFCIDRTSSVPEAFTRRALAHAANTIAAAVTGPAGPATFRLRSMSAASYAPDAEITSVRLPGVPAAPTPPADSPNPFMSRQNQERHAAYERARAAWSGQLEQVRRYARAEAERVRAIQLPADHTGTDVLGCPLRAPDLLGPDGDRHLMIASDLIPSGPQQDVGLPLGSLTGVRVSVAFYCDELAGTCQRRLHEFVGGLKRAGATDIVVIDPQELGE